jgi:hypothetical protein
MPFTDRDGSLVVEALVGIALLSAIGASSHLLHLAAHDARTRSLERMVATWVMRSEVEREAAAQLAPPDDAGDEIAPPTLLRFGQIEVLAAPVEVTVSDAWTPAACTQPASDEFRRSMGAIVRRASGEGLVASLLSVRRMRGLGGTAVEEQQRPSGVLIVRLIDSSGRPVVDAAVTSTSGSGPTGVTESTSETGVEGCIVRSGLPGGVMDVTLGLDDHLDHLHRPVSERRTVSVAPGAVTLLLLHSDRAATLSVGFVAAGSARLPDAVLGGALLWLVAGDGVLPGATGGSVQRVHPGDHDVLVGVCGAARSVGSWSKVRLEPAGHVDLVVELPALLLPEVVVPSGGARVVAQRDTDCPGSGGVRPVLTWDLPSGPASNVPVAPEISLPHGPWVVRVESNDGIRLLGPLRVDVGIDGSVT